MEEVVGESGVEADGDGVEGDGYALEKLGDAAEEGDHLVFCAV